MNIVKQEVASLHPITMVTINGKEFEVAKQSGFADSKDALHKWMDLVIQDTVQKLGGADLVLAWYTEIDLAPIKKRSSFYTELAVIVYKNNEDIIDVF